LLSADTSVEKIFGDRCIRHICIDTMIARPTGPQDSLAR
jgi:hypothetical protein